MTTPERHARVAELFLRALEPEDGLPRRAFLERECAGDRELLARVERLLATDDETWTGIRSAVGRAAASALADGGEAGATIGPYRLVRRIGAGGFGVVWEAEQAAPIRRTVALKLIRRGMETSEVLARFESERRALARMDHPSIATIHDAGQSPDGRPYFAMELVRGEPITEFCDRARLGVAARLGLFLRLCAAVQHAHQKGIIHRDLKPANVLVAVVDGAPVPKVIDFGIAKALEQTPGDAGLTQTGQAVGTPAYMSPEQAGGSGTDVDTRADIYALGVILYELLTGLVPFDRAAQGAARGPGETPSAWAGPPRPSARLSSLAGSGSAASRAARQGAPAPAARTAAAIAADRATDARALVRLLRRDLDWVVLKCLEPDRERRYPTVAALAEDVERYLRAEPVHAGPPSTAHALRTFVRRHRVGVGVAAAVFLSMGGGAGLALWQAIEKHAQRELADAQWRRAEHEAATATAVTDFFVEGLVRPAAADSALGRDVTIREAVDRAAQRLARGGFEDQPAVEAEVRTAIAMVYRTLGRLEEAEAQARRAVALAGRIAPEQANDARAELGAVLVARASFDEGVGLLREVAGRAAAERGERTREALLARAALGAALVAQGRLDESIDALRGALAGLESLPPGEVAPTDLALTRLDLAAALVDRGEFAEAERLVAPASAALDGEYGPDHPRALAARHVRSEVAFNLGRVQECLELSREVAAARERILGPDHPDTLVSRGNEATSLYALGRFAEARDMYAALADRQERVLGPAHTDTLTTKINLGRAMQYLGQTERAEAVFAEALADAERALPPESPLVVNALDGRANCALSLGRHDEALALMRQVVERYTASVGAMHPHTLAARVNLAIAHGRAGDLPGQLAQLRAVVGDARATLPPGRPELAMYEISLGRTLAQLGEAGAAEEGLSLLAPATERLRGTLGRSHPYTRSGLEGLAIAYRALGREDEAARIEAELAPAP